MEKRAFRNAILRLLRKNARITADEIAERLDADAGQVQAAWDEMVSDGTVMGYHTLINEERTDTEEVCAIIEVHSATRSRISGAQIRMARAYIWSAVVRSSRPASLS